MPTFAIYTNLPKSSIPETFLEKASAFISSILKKPESYVTVRVHPDQMMSHGGSCDPCGSVELYSIRSFGANNEKFGQDVAQFVSENLKIPSDRFYVTFIDLKPSDVALGGKTFG